MEIDVCARHTANHAATGRDGGDALIMAGRQPFVSRHPLVVIVIILAVELALLGTLHLVLGWSYLAVAVAGLVVLVLVSVLMG